MVDAAATGQRMARVAVRRRQAIRDRPEPDTGAARRDAARRQVGEPTHSRNTLDRRVRRPRRIGLQHLIEPADPGRERGTQHGRAVVDEQRAPHVDAVMLASSSVQNSADSFGTPNSCDEMSSSKCRPRPVCSFLTAG